jgi:uncharacterized heparinase superfamily protein
MADIADTLRSFLNGLTGNGTSGVSFKGRLELVPDRLRAEPPFLPGIASETGIRILNGQWIYRGHRRDCRVDEYPFEFSSLPIDYAEWLFSFDWLADAAAACDTERTTARMVRDWTDAFIAAHGRFDPVSWSPELIAKRVLNWLNFADLLFGEQAAGRVGRLETLTRHARRLDLNLSKLEGGPPRLVGGLALAALGSVLPGHDRMLESGLSVVNEELLIQILPDGGHIDRRPETLIDLLVLLRQLKGLLSAINRPAPSTMQRAMDRMGPMVRYLSLPDGALTAFHGGGRGRKDRIRFALGDAEPPPRLFRIAPQSGFQRVETPEGCLIMDSMGPPDTLEGHASPLAFEFGTRSGPLIVSCGWHRALRESLRMPMRATAAHSALIVEDTNAMALWTEDPRGARTRRPTAGATARRTEEEAGVWLDASHDGYRNAHGLVHRRRLFVAHEGNDVRGEDTLFVPYDGKDMMESHPFDVRFHLHPNIAIDRAEDGRSAVLTFESGECWRFRTDLAPIMIESSIFIDDQPAPQMTQQLVLSGQTRPDLPPERSPNRIRWTLRREA